MKPYLDSGEYGLSKDVDVALWIQARAFRNEPPLQEVFDFVIVNRHLHSEFDLFKEQEIDRDYSLIALNELLHYWNENTRAASSPIVQLYNKPYLKLCCSDIDELCQWVLEQRARARGNEKIIKNSIANLNVASTLI